MLAIETDKIRIGGEGASYELARFTEPFWAESGAAALAPVEDVAALAETTRSLLADDARRRRMGAAAKALYAERFDVQRIITTLREAVV